MLCMRRYWRNAITRRGWNETVHDVEIHLGQHPPNYFLAIWIFVSCVLLNILSSRNLLVQALRDMELSAVPYGELVGSGTG
jgi:hypothetical protein